MDFLKVTPSSLKLTLSQEDVLKFAEGEGKEEIKKYFDSNPDLFRQEKLVTASHILVSHAGAQRAPAQVKDRTKEQAKEIASKILAEAKQAGAKFEELAKTHTDEPGGKEKGGSLGSFNDKKMTPEFTKAAFSMNKGDVSKDLVETPFGFHIIKVDDIKEEKIETLEQASPKIAKELLEKKRKPELLKEVKTALESSLKEAQPLDGIMKAHDLKWESTGLFKFTASSIPRLGASEALKNAVFGLKKVGDYSEGMIEDRESLYLLRLKSLKLANEELSGLGLKEKKKSLSEENASALASDLSKFKKETLEAKVKSA